ncbi:transport and Golgi organization protein 6 [Bradysia coprophila]|uniref:transport and Golgi organization protein 6 n=1 Tax=Bradysia coprophila TaxID=38358 RepID=UPI00187DCF90|nr:transport and Golgi organization protein 6 [Bradysia coprophila]
MPIDSDNVHNEILSSDLPDGTSQLWKYTVNMYRIFIDIKRLLDRLKIEQSSGTIDLEHLAVSIQICCKFGLEPYLHPSMAKNKCFSTTYRADDIRSSEECYDRLSLGMKTFSQLLLLKEFGEHIQFEEVLLTFLAAVFSTTRNDSHLIHSILDQIYEITPEKHFHTLLILKSNPSLPAHLQKMLHRELMKRLVCPNGFEVLCKTLIKTGDDHTNDPIWKLSSAVFDIVGRKGHQKEFYVAVIDGIFQFFKKCIQSKELEKYVEACVGSLSRIYGLNIDEVSNKVITLLFGRLDELYSPKEIFAGFIALDSHEFTELILINYACFCSSVHVALPSEILVPYLRILCQIFSQIEVTDLRDKIATPIVQCLHNREPTELKSIIDSLLFTDNDNYLQSMHPRIVVKSNSQTSEHKCVVTKASDLNFFDASECLINILKSSGNNILTYNVFIHLFGILTDDGNTSQSKSDLIQSEDELTHLMSQVFKKRVAVYYTLSELINHKPLHYQINENSSEMLSICITILRNRLTDPDNGTQNDDHSTVLVLSIIKEFLEKLKFTQQFDEFLKILQQLKAQSGHSEIVNQINSILVALNHSPQTTTSQYCEKSPFVMAKEMCEESEPHLKVYGLMQFIKLMRTDKDTETINNKHAVLAISLICLRNDDSYVFLNCIKLLIVLCDVLESEVLEMLIAEYQSTENDVDHRLKIGEVIVKVVEGLGPMSYNYKNILINCFLRESTSNINEVRLSSLSNLSSICRILSYQIHNFFQEMMVILKSVIQNDDYLPARRSAVMVLTDVIHGVENLLDFQEILLPVYQTLRDVANNESDRSVRIHAESGLQRLNSKIKDFLIPKQAEHKEIQIFNVKNNEDKKCRFVDLNLK